MSKPVRIRGDVVAQVQAVADGERRSLANMVEVLLLAALTERGESVASGGSARRASGDVTGRPRSVSADDGGNPRQVFGPSAVDATVTKMRDLALRDGKCGADVARGTKCKLCGKVH